MYIYNWPIVNILSVTTESKEKQHPEKFSPTWVVENALDAMGFKLNVIQRIREGVHKSEWKDFIRAIEATEKEFEFLLPSSISSMQKKSLYDKETSERIFELAQLFGLGYKVFDSHEAFKLWLMTPSTALGGKKPFELLDSSLGFELVENEIQRIQFNVYA